MSLDTLICSGCYRVGHAYAGTHPACPDCIRALDGTADMACQCCIEEVVAYAERVDTASAIRILRRLDDLRRNV